MGVTKLEANDSRLIVEFNQEPQINTEKLIRLIQTEPAKYQLIQGTTLKVTSPNESLDERFQLIDSLIESISL